MKSKKQIKQKIKELGRERMTYKFGTHKKKMLNIKIDILYWVLEQDSWRDL